MQQCHRPINWIIVLMLNTLQIETMWLQEIFDTKNSNDMDLDYYPQCMWQIENIVHRLFLGLIQKEDF